MSKNKFFAAIFALRIYRFAQVPTDRLGHAQLRWSQRSTYSVVVSRLITHF